jgi:hypothetical protein
VYANLPNWNLWDLWAVNYAILPDTQAIPGFSRVAGPVRTTPGSVGYLFARDTLAPYARVLPAAAKVPEERVIPTLLDPRFPVNAAVLYPDSASVAPAPLTAMPAPSAARAAVAAWEPGRMTITLDGQEARPSYLLVAETWYPAWHARVDGAEAPVHRANHAQISVELPPGARAVELYFDDPASARGRLVSLVSLLLTGALAALPLLGRRRGAVPS